jgi:hypothetical protein
VLAERSTAIDTGHRWWQHWPRAVTEYKFRATVNYFNCGELASNDEAERSAPAERSAHGSAGFQSWLRR